MENAMDNEMEILVKRSCSQGKISQTARDLQETMQGLG